MKQFTKKLFAMLLAATMSVSAVATLAACGKKEHTAHTWGEWTQTEASHTRKCTGCDETESGAHEYENGKCKICNYAEPDPDAGKSLTFTYKTVDGGIALTAYTGDAVQKLIIPEKYDGKTVVALDDMAINNKNEVEGAKNENLQGIKSIVFSAKLTEIGDENFVGLDAVTEIAIPATVTSVGGGSFAKCKELKKVVITSGSADLGQGSFCDLPKLAELTLPEDITSASENAFKNIPATIKVTYPLGERMWTLKTYKATGLANATVSLGSTVTVKDEASGYEYAENKDGYTIVGLLPNIAEKAKAPAGSEVKSELYLPLTYNNKNVTELGAGVLNANAYTNQAIKTFLSETLTAVDVNSALAAKDTHITRIGDYNYVGLMATKRITLPASIENEELVGCFCDIGTITMALRIPRGVKVLTDCLNWSNTWWFNDLPVGSFFALTLPSSFEKFAGADCFKYSASAPLGTFFWLLDCPEAEAVTTFNGYFDNSTVTSKTWEGAIAPMFLTFPGAGLITGAGNAIMATVNIASYDSIIDLGY